MLHMNIDYLILLTWEAADHDLIRNDFVKNRRAISGIQNQS